MATDVSDSTDLSDRAKELLMESFLNETHIAAFEEALSYNDLLPDTSDPATPHSGRSPRSQTNKSLPQSPSNKTTTSNERELPSELEPPGSAASGARKNLMAGGPLSPNDLDHHHLHRSGSSQTISSGWEKVEKVKAMSDFAPIHQRITSKARDDESERDDGAESGGGGSRRGRRARSRNRLGLGSRSGSAHGGASGWSYQIGRWPLLGFIFLVLFLEFSFYVFIRQIVNSWEWLVSITGGRRKRYLTNRLRTARDWEDWKWAAAEMDDYLEFNEWKQTDEDRNYDYPLVRKVRRSLIHLRKINDVRGIMGVLEICLRNNFAGTEGMRIYSETFIGTKRLVESYVDEVKTSLDFVLQSHDISLEEKRRFYRAVNKNYGSSALCLSGGASFGYYHFGVVKAFLDADLMPRVVTGTSAGGLVAALVCTRTDEELKELLVPELADRLTACEDSMLVWLRRFIKTGARFDTLQWARKATFWTHGSMTFREAYERTGRALNVSVVPHDRHSPTKLLNYLTAPDCVIWSAIIASAAVPGILNAVVLMQKTKEGDLRPMNWGSKFKDGSLRVDIPLESLHLLFNVNYSIVSQVNPHVHLFFFAPRGSVGRPVAHRKGKGWRGGFVLAAVEQYLKLELKKNLRVIRDLELAPELLGTDWSSVFLQRFEGTVNIIPTSRIMDWFHLLTDPDRAEMKRLLRVGQLVTWPKLHMIENRLKIERSVLRGRYEIRQTMHQDRTTTDKEPARVEPAVATTMSSQWHIPLESDVEVGFAHRSRNRKQRAPDIDGGDGPNEYPGNKQRRGHRATPQDFAPHSKAARLRRQEMESMLPVTDEDGAGDEGEGDGNGNVNVNTNIRDRATSEQPPMGYTTLGSSFTRLRTRSFPVFPSSFQSRSSRPGTTNKLTSHSEEAPEELPSSSSLLSPVTEIRGHEDTPPPSTPNTPSRSRLSRWLRPRASNPSESVSSTSTSDEEVFDDDIAEIEEQGRVVELEDILGQDEEGSEESDDEDDLIGVSGERVSKRQIRDAAAAGAK